MIQLTVVVLQAVACVGAGATVLHLLRMAMDLPPLERLAWSFAVGFGVLGWLLFLFGLFGLLQPWPLTLLLLTASMGIVLLGPLGWTAQWPSGPWPWALAGIVLFALACSVLEGLSPPADADTLAYHFALPKDYLAAGRLISVPRAGDGTQPMLVQMSYVPMLALGGERALTLWTMVSGWMPALLFYSLLRRWVSIGWSLAGAVVFLTTPAVLYGAGSGQVDVRMCLFAMTAALAIVEGRRTGRLMPFLLAGLMAGFAAGSKYHGLIFVAAVGTVVLLWAPRRFASAAVFSLAASIAGAQWYLWNWINLGDPVYPMLAHALGWGPFGDIWRSDRFDYFKLGTIDYYVAVPPNLLGWLLYPFAALFGTSPIFESTRTGLGPLVILAAPFALLGAWRARARAFIHPLLPGMAIAVLFYTFWFFTGSGQRVRFLLPIYPLVLAATIVAAERYVARFGGRGTLAAAFAATLAIQTAGEAVFTLNFAQYVFTAETRDDFLQRNLGIYTPVRWINQNLSQHDRVFAIERNTIYLYQVPVYYGHGFGDPIIDIRPTTSAEKTVRQLHEQGITHILAAPMAINVHFDDMPDCFEAIQSFDVSAVGSRALREVRDANRVVLYRLRPSCPLFSSNPTSAP